VVAADMTDSLTLSPTVIARLTNTMSATMLYSVGFQSLPALYRAGPTNLYASKRIASFLVADSKGLPPFLMISFGTSEWIAFFPTGHIWGRLSPSTNGSLR
jgi:hypothetical protein